MLDEWIRSVNGKNCIIMTSSLVADVQFTGLISTNAWIRLQVDSIRGCPRLYGLRHLAASSYQECKRLLYSIQQHCETVACHQSPHTFKQRLETHTYLQQCSMMNTIQLNDRC